MDHQDIRTLKILEKIEEEETPSQRDMARTLNISLGLVNSFVKRLAQKGYFKVTTIPRNRIRYILTPKGAAEKTRLTYQYVQYSLGFYKKARQKLRTLFQQYLAMGIHRVVFYGASDLTEIAYLSLQETSIELTEVVDDEKAGRKYIWGTVKETAELAYIKYDILLITVPEAGDETIADLVRKGVPRKKIATIE